MAGAGRPQGRLKGETEQANALAGFVREVSSGITVRRLAQRYPAGKTSWSEYRSGEKDIPWHLLQRLVHDHAADPRAREVLLARAAHLYEQAARAAEGLGPSAVERSAAQRSAAQQALDRARHAQLLAEEGVAEAEELIRVLVAIVGELRGELGAGTADEAEPAVWPSADGGTAELRRSRLREATRCLAEVQHIRQSAHEVRLAARLEQDAVGLLVDQERTRARADDGREAGAEPGVEPGTELGAEPAAEPAVADAVRAHLPVLRRLEAELVTVRAVLAGRRREVSRMVPAATGSGVVRGELVRVTDNRLTGAHVPGAGFGGPLRRPPVGAGRGRGWSGPAAVVAVLLAAVLVLTGVLVGMRLGRPGPTQSPLDTVPQAAVPRLGPETSAGGGSAAPTGPSPSAPGTASASRPSDGATPQTVGTEAPQAGAAGTAGTAARTAGAAVPPEPDIPSPSNRGGTSAPPPAPAPTVSGQVPVPVTGPPVPGRLGGAPMLPPAGPVAIRNGNSLQCVATPGGGREEGLQVQQFPCGDYPDHFWEARKTYTDAEGDAYYRIVSYNSSLCLAVRDSSAEATAQVVQSACKDDPGQSWKIEKWPHGIRFVNGNSRQCLAVSHGSNAPQAPLMQYPCGDYPDHYWDYGPRR